MELKQYILVGFLFVASVSAEAKWSVTRTPSSDLQAPVVAWSALERSIETSRGNFTIAVITNSVLVDQVNQPKSEDDWAEQMRAALKSPAWKKEQRGTVSIYTAYWKEENRFLRLALEHKSNHWITSFANIRQPYVLMTAYEADLLQAAFFKIEQKAIKSASLRHVMPHLWDTLVPEARAEITIEELSRVIRGFQSSIQTTGNNLGINGANELSRAVRDLGGDFQATGRSVEKGANNISKSIDGASDSLRKALSFQNMFVAGLGLGSGVAAGTALTNFFLDGSAKIVRNLFYSITGKLKPEEKALIESRAGKAFDQLAAQSTKIEEVEKQLALHGLAVAYALKNPAVSLVEKSEADSENLQDQLKTMQENLSKMTNMQERELCSAKVADLKNQIEFLKHMKPIFSKFNSQSELCGELGRQMDEWKLTEVSLHQAKVTLSFEMLTILGGARTRELEAVRDPVATEKRINDCESKNKDLAERHLDLYRAQGCGNRPADSDCMNYARQIELAKETVKTCRSDQKMMEASLSTGVLAKEAEGANTEMQILRQRMHRLLKSDCKQGEKSEICDGEMGDLEKLRNRSDKRVDVAKETCGGQFLATPPPGVSMASLTAGVPNEAADVKTVPTVREPQNEKKPGFFARIWNSITRFFRN